LSLRVLVADDHPPTRSDVRAALEEGGFEVCAEAASADAAVEAALAHRPQVALLDVRMPGNGITAARAIASVLPDTAVVMLTVSRDDTDLLEALHAGAQGYLLKDIDPRRLSQSLRAVLDGDAVLPHTLVLEMISEFRGREEATPRPRRGPSLARLTSREWEVLELMRDGLTTAEMAERLFVAPVTIRTHVHEILRKLRLPDREAAVKWLRGE
jgi:DNA-binding NarL/FixJ family response regulator